MPKLSTLAAVEALDGTESVPAIIEVTPGVFANVQVPLSVVMATLTGASFDNIAGVPGDNAALGAALAAKAPLASPALTGAPTAPTAGNGTNTTQLATTAFVQAALAALIDSAPGALNTLDELAAALGDDANFAATVTTALAGKADAAATTAALALKASLAGAEELLNKRITKRVVPAGATAGALTPNADTTDTYEASGLTGVITMNPPSGTPTPEQQLILYFDDNGVAHGINWITTVGGFRAAKNVTLPAATVAGKWCRVCCIWNAADGFWDVVTVIDQA